MLLWPAGRLGPRRAHVASSGMMAVPVVMYIQWPVAAGRAKTSVARAAANMCHCEAARPRVCRPSSSGRQATPAVPAAVGAWSPPWGRGGRSSWSTTSATARGIASAPRSRELACTGAHQAWRSHTPRAARDAHPQEQHVCSLPVLLAERLECCWPALVASPPPAIFAPSHTETPRRAGAKEQTSRPAAGHLMEAAAVGPVPGTQLPRYGPPPLCLCQCLCPAPLFVSLSCNSPSPPPEQLVSCPSLQQESSFTRVCHLFSRQAGTSRA